MIWNLRLVIGLLSILAGISAASAQSLFEKLVTPGPLSKHHSQYEQDCSKCHASFDKTAQSSLCLSCHTTIAGDRRSGTGFHGTRPDASKLECKTCHTDHKGRTAAIVRFEPVGLDHATMTRFALTGRHALAQCEQCHAPGQAFRKAPTACVSCHKKDEPHAGQLGERCDTCHTDKAWGATRPFDHIKTRFSLTGAHGAVPCTSCHAGQRYKDLPVTCVGCHALQDKHQAGFGDNCERCHTLTTWRQAKFDHARSTRFPLRGAHASLGCDRCHRAPSYSDRPSMACIGCHAQADVHKGQLGSRCEQCHGETNWKAATKAVDHDLTRFPLIGKHKQASCQSCHKTPAFKDTPRNCIACHADTYHRGRFGTDCAQCHDARTWRTARFDHAKTGFALTGAHGAVSCQACHGSGTPQKLPQTCVSCHAKDDVHHGGFGQNCAACHTTISFKDLGNRR